MKYVYYITSGLIDEKTVLEAAARKIGLYFGIIRFSASTTYSIGKKITAVRFIRLVFTVEVLRFGKQNPRRLAGLVLDLRRIPIISIKIFRRKGASTCRRTLSILAVSPEL